MKRVVMENPDNENYEGDENLTVLCHIYFEDDEGKTDDEKRHKLCTLVQDKHGANFATIDESNIIEVMRVGNLVNAGGYHMLQAVYSLIWGSSSNRLDNYGTSRA